LNRTTRSVAPTDAGERLLTQLRPPLDGFDGVIESVNAFREKPVGHLRLVMPPPVAKFVLAPVLARFLERYPEIVIETTVESGLTDIVAGRYDAGFRRGNLVARDMIAMRVTNDMHYHVVASPEYLRRRDRPQTPADLHAHNCIRYRLPGGGFIPWVFAVHGKIVEFDVKGSVVVINDPELVISAALEGVGVADYQMVSSPGRGARNYFSGLAQGGLTGTVSAATFLGSPQVCVDTAATTLYAASGRLMPFNSNSPTGSTFTAFSTFVSIRGWRRTVLADV
jgi:DNA-binding transcriptional LysR family regulator